ncbi:hypothetical protein [Compostimonas suwonensis]|uniref:Uncharacterized protein n=1 Tax=Compostimonas suwonensis TaxID=1048394 RepID=A0A2M9BYW4_9MICO|nr:hypothetical protein [Compostimonas suwonensis]PJJ63273.1 hypothetical protein CLV54_0931 [Compostimonas suwonensis]
MLVELSPFGRDTIEHADSVHARAVRRALLDSITPDVAAFITAFDGPALRRDGLRSGLEKAQTASAIGPPSPER